MFLANRPKAFYLLNCTISILLSVIITTIGIKQYLLLIQVNHYLDQINIFLDNAISFKEKFNKDITDISILNHKELELSKNIKISISFCSASVGSCINKTSNSILKKIQHNELDFSSQIINIYNVKQYVGSINYNKSNNLNIDNFNLKIKNNDKLLVISNKKIVVIDSYNANDNFIDICKTKLNITNNKYVNSTDDSDNQINIYKILNISYVITNRQENYNLDRIIWGENSEAIASNSKNMNAAITNNKDNQQNNHGKSVKISLSIKKPRFKNLSAILDREKYHKIDFLFSLK